MLAVRVEAGGATIAELSVPPDTDVAGLKQQLAAEHGLGALQALALRRADLPPDTAPCPDDARLSIVWSQQQAALPPQCSPGGPLMLHLLGADGSPVTAAALPRAAALPFCSGPSMPAAASAAAAAPPAAHPADRPHPPYVPGMYGMGVAPAPAKLGAAPPDGYASPVPAPGSPQPAEPYSPPPVRPASPPAPAPAGEQLQTPLGAAIADVCANLDMLSSELQGRLQRAPMPSEVPGAAEPLGLPPFRAGSRGSTPARTLPPDAPAPPPAAPPAEPPQERRDALRASLEAAAELDGLAKRLQQGDAEMTASRRASLAQALEQTVAKLSGSAPPDAEIPAAAGGGAPPEAHSPPPAGTSFGSPPPDWPPSPPPAPPQRPSTSPSPPLPAAEPPGQSYTPGLYGTPSKAPRPVAAAATAPYATVAAPPYAQPSPQRSSLHQTPRRSPGVAPPDGGGAQHLRLRRGPNGALRLELTSPHQAQRCPAPPVPDPAPAEPLHHGLQVRALRDLYIPSVLGGSAERAVPGGDVGVVMGPAPEPGRYAVVFESCPEAAINVRPEEVSVVEEEPFDPTSTAVEAHLARMLWDGRDRAAQCPPRGGSGQALPKVNPYYRARLMRFYERYNPHRLPCVAQQLRDYAGKEEAMFDALVRKYGPEPEEKQEILAPGWTQVQSSRGDVFYRHVSGQRQWQRPLYNAA